MNKFLNISAPPLDSFLLYCPAPMIILTPKSWASVLVKTSFSNAPITALISSLNIFISRIGFLNNSNISTTLTLTLGTFERIDANP